MTAKNTKKEANVMLDRKFKKFFTIAMLATIGLTACNNDVHAKPSDHDKDLLTFSEDADIYNNIVKIIEDSYRDGSLAGDVLDEVLYQYSVSVFGRYNRVAKPFNLGSEEITLKEAANAVIYARN